MCFIDQIYGNQYR